MKVSENIKTIFIGVLISFWAFMFIFYYFLFSSSTKNESQKSCILAGYASGSIIDYRLEIYPDSTYYLSTAQSGKTNTWKMKSDTLILFESNQICAKILNLEPTVILDKKYNCLAIMKIKEFNPPQVVKYPESN